MTRLLISSAFPFSGWTTPKYCPSGKLMIVMFSKDFSVVEEFDSDEVGIVEELATGTGILVSDFLPSIAIPRIIKLTASKLDI